MDEEERLLGREVLLGMTEGLPVYVLNDIARRMGISLPRKAVRNRAKIGMYLQRGFGEELATYLDMFLRMACKLQKIDADSLRDRIEKEQYLLLVSRWLLMREGRLEIFAKATENIDRGVLDAQMEDLLRRQRSYEEMEARRKEESRRAAAAASVGLQRAERQAAAAREEAERQVGRTKRTVRRASALVADAEGKRRQVEEDLAAAREENAVLREILRERDEQFKRLEADYQARLQGTQAVRYGRVLIVADPNREAGYTAEAIAMGASVVDFFDGQMHPNDRLLGLLAAADIVIINVAWCKHGCSNAARRSRARIGYMYVSGLKAFRDALDEVGRVANSLVPSPFS